MPMTDEQLRCLTDEERTWLERFRSAPSGTWPTWGIELVHRLAALRQRVAGLEKVMRSVRTSMIELGPMNAADISNDVIGEIDAALAARPTGNADREGDWRYRVGTVKDLLQGQVRAGVNMEELSRQIVESLAARPTGGEG